MADAPTPIRPREETLRRIDWLAVAPWLLVLRAVGATIGWPLVFGAIGFIALGWGGESVRTEGFPNPDRLLRFDGMRGFYTTTLLSRKIADESWLYYLGGPALRHLGWMLIGVLVSQHACRRFAESEPVGLLKSLRRCLRYAPRVAGAAGLLTIPAVLCVLAMKACGIAVSQPLLTPVAGTLSGVAGVIAGLPLALLLAVLVYASPLLVAAVVVDDADPFDAVSRTLAYCFQRPCSLALCVFIGWIGFFVGGLVVNWLIKTTLALTAGFTASDMELLTIPTAALMGFFPAYYYCAGAATYLVMRHQVDGQPLDEIAQPAGEA